MKNLSKSQKRAAGIMAITVIVAIVIFIAVNYINDYYRATDTAKQALLGTTTIEVVEKENYYLFTERENKLSEESNEDTSENKAENNREITQGIVFYPGGKVEETAYAPLLLELAENGYEVYLVKMPAKLAIFGMNTAEDIFKEASHIEDWTMMGHSLGGAMAASFSANHDEEVDALVLLAAYSTEDLSDKDMDVYSIYGSEDKVLNMEKYQECYGNLPEDVVEAVIDGGNHAYYAYYGEQDGDGVADISREEQQESVLDIFFSAN